MGIRATGDPLWWDSLTADQQDAVLAMMHVDAEEEDKRDRESKPRPAISDAPPPGWTQAAWDVAKTMV